VLAVVVLAFGSCLDIETRIELEDDNTGRLTVEYVVENDLWDLGIFDEESSVRAVPLSERDFRRAARRVEGAELLEYSSSRNEETTQIRAVLSFSSLEALSGLYADGAYAVEIRSDGNGSVYRQEIRSGEEYRIEDTAFLETYLEDYTLSFTIEAPRDVTSSNMGTVVESGREVELSLSLTDYLTDTEPMTWEIRY
jgi:hypothetical protein